MPLSPLTLWARVNTLRELVPGGRSLAIMRSSRSSFLASPMEWSSWKNFLFRRILKGKYRISRSKTTAARHSTYSPPPDKWYGVCSGRKVGAMKRGQWPVEEARTFFSIERMYQLFPSFIYIAFLEYCRACCLHCP
ncbi:hypothetical protein M427DRAFT_264737 [Gonapodya prolifera JEL478]|uniref:Uncharacterized protein n=1 Tax=Gonapodya prolifera (strain JEL478) TaxID=1344416 RepID=A0A139AK81_GONPJ|nr:hypothetical protein M427DRAFT_264737 [Gonapodya prolifera JEL478]|eukprot:KXS17177.1 hypothetical protein M427DRAFT_264737 [Gonapodya prolifera JEL478]